MEPKDVIGFEDHLCKRIAARNGLSFYICGETMLVERGEYGDETREPTGAELAMWYSIVPEGERSIVNRAFLSNENLLLEATPKEVFCSLNQYAKVVYLNPRDFAGARDLDAIDPCTTKDLLLTGLICWFGEKRTQVYISRHIPQGFYLPCDARIPELNWRPPSGERKLAPPLDEGLKAQLSIELRPLMLSDFHAQGFKLRPKPSRWRGEVCKKCMRRNVIGFQVPDEVWKQVVRGEFNVLCPSCFDELADDRSVRYKFTEVFPVSWSMWED